jgi:hypothetical protein
VSGLAVAVAVARPPRLLTEEHLPRTHHKYHGYDLSSPAGHSRHLSVRLGCDVAVVSCDVSGPAVAVTVARPPRLLAKEHIPRPVPQEVQVVLVLQVMMMMRVMMMMVMMMMRVVMIMMRRRRMCGGLLSC